MLDDPRSHGLWEKTAPPAPQAPALDEAITADVAIVGGGYTGLSAALHLAQAGLSVALLEAIDFGFGGAGRNVGLINGGMWVMPDDIPGVLGPVHGERALELLGGAPLLVREIVETHDIPCEIETNGTLHLAVGETGLKELRERHRQWTSRGAPVELLSAEETARRVGSDGYAGALFDPRAGTIQPLAYARGLARAAQTAGARLFAGSPVIATERAGENWTVRTARGAVTAAWVLVATDAYSTGPFAPVRAEQLHLPYFNFATVPLSDNLRRSILPGREGCWDTKEILSSFRMDQSGRLVFGSVGALRNTGAAVHRAWAQRALATLFPQLGDIPFEAEWYGKIGMTTDAVPRFHRFDRQIVGFSGYNGRGIAPGTVFGKTLARHVLGELSEDELPLPVTDVKAQGFRTAREAYYEAGAQLAHLAGYRF
ncbi:FAD-dependent oxidoreductase [Rhizobium rhizosphaerae]|uniref:FAD-dependent oxidoreductase n=1 Tax=Xaviernesmea rhizosphaerae TaxID=1672749 RepID=A0A1Q9AQB5_9HYPH|nr:FAD-binding oxidoreductase [Xaviernesmea rhizosphaerae]OLP57610.1 FAD-dependent oxidoreductase [Xaviernesmea rhizosphaerae]OQP83954.1 FAD-dependent oxidoreductase [Xaviernesmea rhizosphaerae]